MRKRNFEEETTKVDLDDLDKGDDFDAKNRNAHNEEYSEIAGEGGIIFETFDERESAAADEITVFDRESFMDTWLDEVSPEDIQKAAKYHKNVNAAPQMEMSIVQACEKLLHLLPDEGNVTLKEWIRSGNNASIDELTEYATVLIENGVFEAYDLTKSDLIGLYQSLIDESCV